MKLAFDPTKWFSERPLLICFAFGALSILATLHNKFIFSHHIIGSSNMLLLIQNIVTISALYLLRRLKILDFEVTMSSRGDWLCGLAYALSVVCGLGSLVFVNVVMFGALKRWTSLISWAIEWKYTPSETTMKCLPPLVLMMIGTIQASFYDFQFSFIGYSLAMMSCVAQGAAYELGRRVARRNKGVCAVLYSNSVVALIVLTVLLTLNGELWRAVFGASAPSQLHAGVIVNRTTAVPAETPRPTFNPRYGFVLTSIHLCINAFTCLSMNYFIFLNCFVNSPLAHSVTGNMKVVMTTILGGIMFGFSLDVFGAIGLIMNTFSGFWFSAIKLRAKMDSKKRDRLTGVDSFITSAATGLLGSAAAGATATTGSGHHPQIHHPHMRYASNLVAGAAGAPSDAPPRGVASFGTLQKQLSDPSVNATVGAISGGVGNSGGNGAHGVHVITPAATTTSSAPKHNHLNSVGAVGAVGIGMSGGFGRTGGVNSGSNHSNFPPPSGLSQPLPQHPSSNVGIAGAVGITMPSASPASPLRQGLHSVPTTTTTSALGANQQHEPPQQQPRLATPATTTTPPAASTFGHATGNVIPPMIPKPSDNTASAFTATAPKLPPAFQLPQLPQMPAAPTLKF